MARILVIDDHLDVLHTIADMLIAQGHIVHEEPDAAQGLLALRQYPRPDLIITDLQMPGMDGLEFGRQVKAHFPDQKLFLITGGLGEQPNELIEEAILQIGFSIVFFKPIGLETLIRAVHRTLGS